MILDGIRHWFPSMDAPVSDNPGWVNYGMHWTPDCNPENRPHP